MGNSRRTPPAILVAMALFIAVECFPIATGNIANAQTLSTNPAAAPTTNPTTDNAAQPECKDSEQKQHPIIAWTVLPSRVVRDNYGHNVSNKYIAIDVIVHNGNTCNQLVVKGFQFLAKSSSPYVTTDPTLVKGSITKGQQVGFRNTAVQVIKTVGLIATGASGFFKDTGASATYNRGVTIFSDPFEKGIEMIFPDTTVTYLSNWDKDEVFKNGFVVDAGKDARGRIFMPIDVVCSRYYPNHDRQKGRCRAPRFGQRYPAYDADDIKATLGDMNVFGQEIQIRNVGPIK
jgi:hypothetical protein